jgi:hypothetical protein
VCALDSGIHETGAVAPASLEECARVAAVLGACPLIAGIEGAEATVRPEIGAVPEIHHPEHALLDPSLTGNGVALEETQFLEPFENPEREIDLDAVRIEDLAVEFVRQSFANQQLVDFGAPARSHLFAAEEVQQPKRP